MQRSDVAAIKTDDLERDDQPLRIVSARRGAAVPRWLRCVVFGSAAVVLAFGAGGLALVIFGWYSAPAAFVVGAAGTVALVALARPALARPAIPVTGSAHAAAAVGVVLILSIAMWNGAHASHHVLVNRDGGAYANEGRWIARTGQLSDDARVGPFATEPKLDFVSAAVYVMPDGTLQYQFAHLLPVLLAEAYSVAGNRGLFHAPALLSGVALLSFFVLAWKLLRRPWFALAATLALAFSMPEVSFSRDTYSEIPSQVLLFTAIWLLTTDQEIRWPVALTAGLFLGALEAVRIDALVFLIGIPPLLAVLWIRHRGTDRGRRYALARGGAFVAGLVPGMALGLDDLMHHSGRYYIDLSHNVHKIEAAVVASAVCTFAVVLCWRWIARTVEWVARHGGALAASAVVLVIGFTTWVLRPRVQTLHGGVPTGLTKEIQIAEHQLVDATRTYYEFSMTWLKWYLGPLTVAFAIVGAAMLVYALLLGRIGRELAALALLAPASALYLWKADASPDHIWVMRRFLVSAFPTAILLAVGAAVFLFARRGQTTWVYAARAAAVVLVIVAVAYPLSVLRSVRNMTEQRGYITVIEDVCDMIGPDAAVVVLASDPVTYVDQRAPQPLRGWCGADVASLRRPDAGVIARLAAGWAAQGRPFFVAAARPDIIRTVAPDAPIVSTRPVTNPHFLRRTLTHRPDGYESETFQMSVARVTSHA